MEVQHTINGRRVSETEFYEHFRERAISAATDAVAERIRRVRCPIHGQSARVTPKPAAGGHTRYEIAGCREQLIERTKEAIPG